MWSAMNCTRSCTDVHFREWHLILKNDSRRISGLLAVGVNEISFCAFRSQHISLFSVAPTLGNCGQKGTLCQMGLLVGLLLSCVWLFATPWTVAARLLCPWDSPGKNTGVGCHFFLQGIFPTQKLNPCLLHLLNWQADPLPSCHLGSPVR